jgi:hypothetical protein
LLNPLMEGNVPIDHFDKADMIVVGDPEECLTKMKHYADLGVDQLICYVQFGYHDNESVLKTIELLGKEVIPELEKYKPKKSQYTAVISWLNLRARPPLRRAARRRLPTATTNPDTARGDRRTRRR